MRGLAVVLLLLCGVFTGCRARQTAYVVADIGRIVSMGGRGRVLESMEGLAGFSGVRRVVVTAEGRAGVEEAVRDTLAEGDAAVVVVLSPTDADMGETAAEHEDILLVAAGGTHTPSANLLVLLPGRSEAFRRAGELIGQRLRAEEEDVLCGIITAKPTETGVADVAGFEEGLRGLVEESRIVTRELRSITDKARAAKAVRELREQGAHYFLLKTYGLTGHCLAEISREGGVAVVEDWVLSNAYADVVSYSIEDDWATFFDQLASHVDSETRGWQVATLSIPWRIEEEHAREDR